MSNHNKSRFGGRGYYIALVLCAAALGITGYVYSRNEAEPPVGEDTQVLASQPTSPVNPTEKGQSGMRPIPPETTQPTVPKAGKLQVCPPVEGEVIVPYAMEVLAYNQTTRDWRVHNGMDFAAGEGTAVVAAAEGEVYTVYEDEQMGMTVVIRHEGGYITKYASLGADVLVSPGDKVTMGQQIGVVGSTALMESALGDHLHFCVTRDDEPVDPELFLNQ